MTCGTVNWNLDYGGVIINITATISGDNVVFSYSLDGGEADLLGLYLDFFNDGVPLGAVDAGAGMTGSTADGTHLDGFDYAFQIGTHGAGDGVTTEGTVSMSLALLASFGVTGASNEEILYNLAQAQLGIRATSVVAPDDPSVSSLKLAETGTYCPPPPPPPPMDDFCFTGLTRGAWGTPTAGAGIWDDGYATCDSLEATFGINSNWVEPGKGKTTFADLTLVQALNFAGGGQNQLMAQATAALLNAADSASANPELGEDGYRFTTSEIIAAVKWAFGLDSDIDGDGDIDANSATDNVFNATFGNALATILDTWNNASHTDANLDGIEDGCTMVFVPQGQDLPSLYDMMFA